MSTAEYGKDKAHNPDTPLYNSRLIDSYIKFIRSNYENINVTELLKYANMESYQVADENHWFTQRQVNRFHEKLSMLTGNRKISRQVGRFSASPGVLGHVRRYTIGLIGPARAYEMIGKYSGNLTKSSTYNAEIVGRNKARITVTPRDGVQERPFQCESRLGYFEAIAAVFNYRVSNIEHTECVFKGQQSCVYTITWDNTSGSYFALIRNYMAFLFLGVLAVTLYNNPLLAATVMLPWMAFGIAGLSLLATRYEKQALINANDSLRQSTDELLSQASLYYDRAMLLNEIGTSLIQETQMDRILARAISLFEERLPYDRGLILLANEDKTRLVFESGFGYSPEHQEIIQRAFFRLDRKDARGVFTKSFREQKPFLIHSLDEIRDSLSSRSLEFAEAIGAKSFICCPIMHERESLGILAVDNMTHNAHLLQSDVNFLMTLTHTIGISINNVLLFKNKERQLRSIISVMASTIDARDPLTSGHSERVTEYAVGIARELGLPAENVETIRVASLLHDYGKIGISDSILKKQGRLTSWEREEIKTHTDKTRLILEKVNFDGIYREVPNIAGSHHERHDGSGYPKGLRGESIPMGARILAIADFFEAVTSKRHYREPMPTTDALDMLIRMSGKEFDGKVVRAFIKYYESGYCRVN